MKILTNPDSDRFQSNFAEGLIINKDYPYQKLYITLAFLLGITAARVLGQVGSLQNDLPTTAMTLLGVYFGFKALNPFHENISGLANTREKRTAPLWLIFFSGLATGAAVGLKLTNTPYALSLGIAIFFCGHQKKRIPLSFFFGFGITLGFLVLNGSWMWALNTHFHSALFPFYNTFFRSPDYAFVNIRDHRYILENIFQVFTYPFDYLKENSLSTTSPMRDWRLGAWLILSLCYGAKIYFLKSQKLSTTEPENPNFTLKFLLIYTWSAYFIWINVFDIYRYAEPLQLISGLCLILCYDRLFLTQNSNKIWSTAFRILLVLLTALILKETIYSRFSLDFFSKKPTPNSTQEFITLQPPTGLSDTSLIVITGDKQSFVAPFFPPSVIFASTEIWGGFPNPLGIQAIKKHQGPLYLLFGSDPNYEAQLPQDNFLLLNHLRFELDKQKCQTLKTNQSLQQEVYLCPAKLT